MGLCYSESHIGSHKLYLKLRRLFWWPDMCLSVARFCQSCMQCQLRQRLMVAERVPITAVMRPATTFEIVSVD